MPIRPAALLSLLLLPGFSAAAVPARPSRGLLSPESPECVESLQFDTVEGRAILTGLTGSFDAGVYATEEEVTVLARSPGGEFRVVFSSGALKAIADINKHRTEFFAKNRRMKGEEMTPNCLGTLRFNAKRGRLEGVYKPRKARGFEIWEFDFNLKGETEKVTISPGKGDPPMIHVLEDLKDGHYGDGLSIEPFAFHVTLAAPKPELERAPRKP